MIVLANLAWVSVLLLHGTAPQLWGNTFAHLDSIAAGILLAVLLGSRAPNMGNELRFTLIACALLAIALRAHFVMILPLGALGWGETLLGWPVVAGSCTAIVFAFIGLKWHVRPLQYLGKISYGLYVYHFLCIKIADRILSGRAGSLHMVVRIFLSLAITILIATVSYFLLEKPFLTLKQRFAYVNSRPV